MSQINVDRLQESQPVIMKGFLSSYFWEWLFYLRERTGGDQDNINRNIRDLGESSGLSYSDGYVNATAAITITLMPSPRIGKPYWFRNSSGGSVTLDGGDKDIDGSSTLVSSTAEVIKLIYNGTEWQRW